MRAILALVALAALLVVAGAATADTATVTVSAGNANYNGNAGVAVTFSGTASSPGHTIQTMSWNFGDGNCNNGIANRECTRTGSSVTHIFTTDATYSVVLTATDNHGNVGTHTVNAIIANADTTAPSIAAPSGGFIRTGTAGSAVQVDAVVTDNVGVSSVTLHYARDTDSDGLLSDEQDQTVAMTQTGGANNWRGSIPSNQVSGLVGYYVEAADAAANTVRIPAAGTANANQAGNVPQIVDARYVIALGDSLPPVITAVSGSVTTTSADGTTIPIQVTITDGSALATTTLYYRAVGATSFPTSQAITNPSVSGSTYTFNVPVSPLFSSATQFQYYVEATDSASTPNTARLPAADWTTSPRTATINRLPVVTHTALADTTITAGSAISVGATVTDDRGLSSVVLNVRRGTAGAFTAVSMSASGNTWTGEIPSSLLASTSTMQYYIVATDTDGVVRTHPSSAPTTPLSFTATVNAAQTNTGGGNTGGGNTGGGNTGGGSNIVTDTIAPVIGAFGPTGNVTAVRPVITASYSDNVAVVAGSIVLTVDGVPVTPTASATSLTFTPLADLAAGEHTVALTVKDAANNAASQTWTFRVVAVPVVTPTPTTSPSPTVPTNTTQEQEEEAEEEPAVVISTPVVTPSPTPTPRVPTVTVTPVSADPTPVSPTPEKPTRDGAPGGTITTSTPRAPGFEVVALVGALGVALLVLRRR